MEKVYCGDKVIGYQLQFKLEDKRSWYQKHKDDIEWACILMLTLEAFAFMIVGR